MNKLFTLAFTVLVSACAVGPDYARPESDLPRDWGQVAAEESSLQEWWLQFNDPELTAFVSTALERNNDLKVAVANVDAAAAALQLSRADYLPTINAGVGATRGSASENAVVPAPSTPYTEYRGGLFVNYEFDIWGRIRRANEAALAELHHDVAVRDTVRSGVAAAVAQAYFASRALDRRVALLERLHATRAENLALQKTRLDAGLISPYDYEQSRSETAAIAAQVPLLKSARLRAVTALAELTGASPNAMFATWSLLADASPRKDADIEPSVLPSAPVVPMGLPSTLLERRPDIRAAEQRLIAANARIGVARAAWFPQLSLTGFAGGISTAFSNLFDSPSQSWDASLGLSVPLTDLNRIGANVDVATARHAAAQAGYAKAVQAGFRETLDALGNVAAARDVMQAQDVRVDALANAWRVARARYEAGRIGYLDVLDVERQLRDVEQQQVISQLELLNATIDLYRALGGGWETQLFLADD